MPFKLLSRYLLFAGLCVCLASGGMWLRNGLAFNTGQIVFTSRRDGNSEIYVMDTDGGNQENLTNHPAYDAQPDWSPDGRKIAFVSGRDGSPSQIHVMDADGKNVIKLTIGWGGKSDPDWSPDGRKIAFTVDNLFPKEDHIAVMDADGKNRKKLEDQAMYPSWSPDGGEIAFVSWRDGANEIYVTGVGGLRRKRVTQDLVDKWSPSFSPDGRRIAYAAAHEEFIHIHVIGADSRNRVRLTHNEEGHWAPAWSPDGRIIAYDVWDGFGADLHGSIHLMTADGKYLRQLSDDRGARDFEPDISPLGLAVSPAANKITIWGRLKKLAPNLR